MTEDIRRITVRIGGTSYQLVFAQNEQYARRVAARADEMIRRVMQNNPQLSQSMATVLALVNSLDDLTRISERLEAIEQGRKESEKQAEETRQELKRLREQNWEMKKQLLELRDRCDAAENRLRTREQESASMTEAAQEISEYADEAELYPHEEPVPALETGQDPEQEPKENAEPAQPDYDNYTQTNIDDYIRDSGWSARPHREQQDEPDVT